MASNIKHYADINDMLGDIRLPFIKHPLFYIARFEEHDFNNDFSPAYTHDYFEISFSLGYNVNVSIGQNTSNAIDNNLIFASPGQLIKWEGNDVFPENAVGYLILFKPEFLLFANGAFSLYEQFPFLNRHTLPTYQISEEQQKLFQDFFEKMNLEYKRFDENSLEIIRSYLSIFLFEAKRFLAIETAQNFLKTRADEITFQFENAIIHTKHKRQAIKYYAQQLNISPIYLSECIKKSTGKTAKQIINEYLILEAKSLLKQSSEPIAQVAYSLGFEDHSNFVKYFKKQVGETPRRFRGA